MPTRVQETANYFGARVEASDHREYGEAIIKVLSQPADAPSHLNKLFEGLPEESPVWMSHSDRLHSLPEGFTTIATTESAPYAAIAHNDKPIYGIQFHPEVTHSLRGKDVLQRFVLNICGCSVAGPWSASLSVRLCRLLSLSLTLVSTTTAQEEFIDKEIERIRKLVGPTGQVIGAVSGGVDSSVAAKLMHEAIGDRCGFVIYDSLSVTFLTDDGQCAPTASTPSWSTTASCASTRPSRCTRCCARTSAST